MAIQGPPPQPYDPLDRHVASLLAMTIPSKARRALAAAVATAVLTAPAYAADIVCSTHDTVGNNLTYAFGGNSTNANGTFGGTMVETGFDRNGTSTFSQVGWRPI